MIINQKIFFKLFIISNLLIYLTSCSGNKITYPPTQRIYSADTFFGKIVPEYYRWLEYDTASAVQNWVELQSSFTESYLSGIPLRDSLREELTRYYNFPRRSSLYVHNGLFFSFRNDGLQNQSVFGISSSEQGTNFQVLLDPNKLSKDGTISLSGWSISKNGKFLAYQLSESGSDWNRIFVKKITDNQQLTDTLQNVKFSDIAWYQNGFYYSRYPKRGGTFEKDQYHSLYYHELGKSQSADKLIFQDPSLPLENVSAQVTQDENWLVLYRSSGASAGNAVFFRKSNEITGFQALDTNRVYEHSIIGSMGNYLLLHTNHNAPNYCLQKVPINQPDKRIDLLSEKKDVLRQVLWNNRFLVTHYLVEATSRLVVHDSSGGVLAEVSLPALGTVSDISLPKDSAQVYFAFTSFLYPSSIYRYDILEKKLTLLYRPPTLLNPDSFETKQIRYKSTDGVEVPMFIVHKRGIQLDGNHDCMLYGYGGFNISILPDYSVMRAVWLNRGGIFALPSLRGGGEFGENWHQAGMLLKKQQVFDDFIAAAEFLTRSGYTNSQRLVISGRSNGGLLVGACLTQRPDLYKVALPAVGVLDMLRFQRFTIGWAWVSEYGSSEDSSAFQYLYKYSPLHNLKEGTVYPATFITTADHDDRVAPAHSFKFAAELQYCQKGNNPILIRIDRAAGHGSGKPIHKRIAEEADILAFTYKQLYP